MKVNDRYCSFYYELDDDYCDIEVDRDRTALLIVDMQHHFLTRPKLGDNASEREKAYYAKWGYFYDRIEKEVVPNNQKLLAAFRERNMFVSPRAHHRSARERARAFSRSKSDRVQRTASASRYAFRRNRRASEACQKRAGRHEDDRQRPDGDFSAPDAS